MYANPMYLFKANYASSTVFSDSIIDCSPGAIKIGIEEDIVRIRPEIHKHRCSYCCGETYDDMRGHCGACGAPREERHWPGHDYGERAWDDSFLTMQWNPGCSAPMSKQMARELWSV